MNEYFAPNEKPPEPPPRERVFLQALMGRWTVRYAWKNKDGIARESILCRGLNSGDAPFWSDGTVRDELIYWKSQQEALKVIKEYYERRSTQNARGVSGNRKWTYRVGD